MTKLSMCLSMLVAMVLVACQGQSVMPTPEAGQQDQYNNDNEQTGEEPVSEESVSEGEGEGEGGMDAAAQSLECGPGGCAPPTHDDGYGRSAEGEGECDPVLGCAPPAHNDGGGAEGEGEGEGQPDPDAQGVEPEEFEGAAEGEGEGEDAPLEVAGQEGEGEGEEVVPPVVDCDDQNPCTDDSESNGLCANISKSEGTVCGASGVCRGYPESGETVCQQVICPATGDVCTQNVFDSENVNGNHCKVVPVDSRECRMAGTVTCTFACPANLTHVVVWYRNQSEELRCGQDPLELSWGELCAWASPSFAFNGRNGDYWGSGDQVTVTCNRPNNNSQHPDGGSGKRLIVFDGNCW